MEGIGGSGVCVDECERMKGVVEDGRRSGPYQSSPVACRQRMPPSVTCTPGPAYRAREPARTASCIVRLVRPSARSVAPGRPLHHGLEASPRRSCTLPPPAPQDPNTSIPPSDRWTAEKFGEP
ncbi:hypothetical protein BJY59DRAFT_704343 [Rhodotorula toruloides]